MADGRFTRDLVPANAQFPGAALHRQHHLRHAGGVFDERGRIINVQSGHEHLRRATPETKRSQVVPLVVVCSHANS